MQNPIQSIQVLLFICNFICSGYGSIKDTGAAVFNRIVQK